MSTVSIGAIATKEQVDRFCASYFNADKNVQHVALKVFVNFEIFILRTSVSSLSKEYCETPIKISDFTVSKYFMAKMQVVSLSDNIESMAVYHQVLGEYDDEQFLYNSKHISHDDAIRISKDFKTHFSGCYANVVKGEEIPFHECDFSTLLTQISMLKSVVKEESEVSAEHFVRRISFGAKMRHVLSSPFRAIARRMAPPQDLE
ncbi:MAG: hypothetical protein P0S94_03685 [Simkaniaceae bacterium]|nr:hypothetical protein [Simkaniaceae bacterium]